MVDEILVIPRSAGGDGSTDRHEPVPTHEGRGRESEERLVAAVSLADRESLHTDCRFFQACLTPHSAHTYPRALNVVPTHCAT